MNTKIIAPIETLTLFVSAATKANESIELISPALIEEKAGNSHEK